MNNSLIIGNNEHIRKTELNKLKSKYLPSGESDLNYSVYTPDEIDGIMDAVQTHSLFADRRVVVIKDFDRINEKSFETISNYLGNPLETTILVMVAAASFKKTKNYKKLIKLVKVINADNPGPETVRKWVKIFFQKQNIPISSEAVELIVESKGDDTTGLHMELEKLVSFSDGEQIECSHVEQLVGRSVKETIFNLVDAINKRDAKWLFKIINDLYDQKKQPHEILGYIGWYLRIMQKINMLKRKGVPESGIPAALGYNPGYARRLLFQSKKYPLSRIEKWNALLIRTDMDIKTGKKPAELALDMLLTEFLK